MNPPHRILAVEDDRELRQLNAGVLVQSRCTVDVAEDGAAAWKALPANRYELLITDYNMPRLTGVELVRKLRSSRMRLMANGTLPMQELAQNPWFEFAATLAKPYATDPLKCSLSLKAVWDFHWKRTLDALLILLTLPFLIPLALLIALLIRSVSAGPVLFRQERVGYRSRRFGCFKFRTMFVDADTTAHQGHLHQLMNSNTPMMKMDSRGDPRIIPFGLFLRASGLDELPQLINVLRDEMSLVGPRPCLPYEYDKYLPWQKERFCTVPGLTGLWQVSGKNRTTFLEMIQLDIKYAKNKTLWWDLKIILMTIPALIIQMLETRLVRKPHPAPIRPKTSYSNRTTQSPSLAKAALVGAVHARGDEEVWMRKETKLNL